MTTEAVLFDLGGTLVSMPGLPSTIGGVLRRYGYSVDDATIAERHKLLTELIDFPDETSASFYSDFNQRLLRALGVPASPELAREIYDDCSSLSWEPAEDIAAIASLGVPIGVVSNWDRSLESVLATLPFVFDVVVGSSATALRKPDTAPLVKAAELLGVPAHAIAYVGDSVYLDVVPARAAGMTPILLDRLNVFPGHHGLQCSDLTGVGALLGLPARPRLQ